MPNDKDKPFIDWSKIPQIEPEHPLSRPLGYTGPTLKKGEIPRRPSDAEIRAAILADNKFKQPTDEELFGGGVVTQEQADQLQKNWENSINDWYTAAKKPIDNKESSWASGKSFNETLSEEELIKRNMCVDE